MRSPEEIDEDIVSAREARDADALLVIAAELEAGNDVSRLANVFLEISDIYNRHGSLEESLDLCKRSLDLYNGLDDREGSVFARISLGEANFYRGDSKTALAVWQEALADATEMKMTDQVAAITLNIGNAMSSMGDFAQALAHYQHALAIVSDEDGRASTRALCHHNSGIIYYYTGLYADAMSSWHTALALYEENGDSVAAAMIQENLGNIQSALGNTEAALGEYEKAIEVFRSSGATRNLANCYSNKALALITLGRAHEAIALAAEIVEVLESSGVPTLADRHLERIASSLCDANEIDEAEKIINSTARPPADDPAANTNVLQVMGLISEHKGDLDKAKTLLTEALMLATDHSILSSRMGCHEHLRDLARKTGDFEAYIEHSEAYQKLRDESSGHEATMKLAVIEKQRELAAIEQERERERTVLYSTLPKVVADRVVRGEQVNDHFDEASVIFLDIVGFTTISDRIPPGHVVHLLAAIFRVCDEACKKHGVTKVKTIGDSYMAVAGVPEPLPDHAERAARAALDMLQGLNELELTMDPSLGDTSWTRDVGEITVRIGLHCGQVVAGVVGDERLQYDVWGDTVNVASRMESTSEPGRIQVSDAFAQALKGLEGAGGEWEGPKGDGLRSLVSGLRERGTVEVKGKGTMTTFWLEGALES